ncbi:hypothetical protein A2348_03235 [Candidatus Uhrbacteria bacterium RIFOXYB12_FULL_58_10]|nr:MAG: hypothetical protein A2348_03235 [Candidatus Uhrbacteria bacterium RIFOXYB12_FULL_58_10]OGL99895.1 MAG: hypothetical protein A2501_05190 [Candidatus Uhrbacteria bacterium RIFOXYC12_FULL_57_11]
MRVTKLPLWAGILGLLGVTYVLNVFVIPVIFPFLSSLPAQGPIPFFTTGAGVLGVWFALSGEEDRAEQCASMCTSFGFLGTAVGFTNYLMVFQKESTDMSGLMLAFVTTAHGLVMAALVAFLLIWNKRSKRGADHG